MMILVVLFVISIGAYALGDGVIMTLESVEKRKPKPKRKWMQRSAQREAKIQELIKQRDAYRKKHGL